MYLYWILVCWDLYRTGTYKTTAEIKESFAWVLTDWFPKCSVVHVSPTLCKKAYSQPAPEVCAPWNEVSGSALCCQSCTGTSAWMQALHNMNSDRALFFTFSLSSEVIQVGLRSSTVFKAKFIFSFIHPLHKTILLSLCSVLLLHCCLLLLLSFSELFMLRVLPQSPSNPWFTVLCISLVIVFYLFLCFALLHNVLR